MNGYVPLVAYLHIDAVYENEEVVGAKVISVTQKKPKKGRSVRIDLQIPLTAFEPFVLPTLKLPVSTQLIEGGVIDV